MTRANRHFTRFGGALLLAALGASLTTGAGCAPAARERIAAPERRIVQSGRHPDIRWHIEAEHPDLVGGLSACPATSSHGPFVHVDARGARARW